MLPTSLTDVEVHAQTDRRARDFRNRVTMPIHGCMIWCNAGTFVSKSNRDDSMKMLANVFKCWGLALCLVTCLFHGICSAQLKPPESAPTETAPTETAPTETAPTETGPQSALSQSPPALLARIATTIERLGAREFDVRQQAYRDLQRIGGAAIPALDQAAQSSDRETRMRALDLLKIHWRGSDAELSDTAEDVLKRLAQDENHPAGRLAANILDNRLEKIRSQLEQQAQFAQRIKAQNLNLRIRVMGARIIIPPGPALPGGGGAKNATVKISDSRHGKMSVKIANGKITALEVILPDGTQKKYKDIKDVKEKHPDLFKRYESIAKRSGYPLPK